MDRLVKFFKAPTQYRIIILTVVFGFVSFKYMHQAFSPAPPPPDFSKVVEVIDIKPVTFKKTIRLIGTIKAKKSARLISKSRGVFRIYKHAGTAVTHGDEIAGIENVPIQNTYNLYSKAEKIALEQYQRTESLLKSGVVSKQTVEEKKKAWLDAQNKLESAKIEYDKIIFKAPFDGIIGTYLVQDGNEINESIPVVTLFDPQHVFVEFGIPAPVINKLQHKAPHVDIDGKTYTLHTLQTMVDENTHMSPASLTVERGHLIIGTVIDVNLCIVKKENSIVIPESAIFQKDMKSYVYKIHQNKTVLTQVEAGHREQNAVEITKGLSFNDQIVVENPSRLSHDLAVQVIQHEDHSSLKPSP